MFVLVVFVCLAAAAVGNAHHGVTGDSKHAKHYPGFTFRETKDGQFLKILGPIYGKLNIETSLRMPFKLSDKANLTVTMTPTIELFAVFADGTVNYNGLTLSEFDGDEDLCMRRSYCPLPKGKPVSYSVHVSYKDIGLMPGWYYGKVNLFSLDQSYNRFHVIGVDFKIKVVE